MLTLSALGWFKNFKKIFHPFPRRGDDEFLGAPGPCHELTAPPAAKTGAAWQAAPGKLTTALKAGAGRRYRRVIGGATSARSRGPAALTV